MTPTNEKQAHCLCGAITINAPALTEGMGVCHCDTCRLWGGGPMMAVKSEQQPEIKGSEHLSVYSSSDWAERGFCKTCGTHLFYRLKEKNTYMFSAGLFDKTIAFAMHYQIFIDQKPEYYSLANETPKMTAAEVMAKFAEDGA